MTLDLDALRGHTAGPWTRNRYGEVCGADGTRISLWDSGLCFGNRTPESEANANLTRSAESLLSELLAYRAKDAAVAELVAALEKIAVDLPFSDDCYEIASGALAAFRQGAADER